MSYTHVGRRYSKQQMREYLDRMRTAKPPRRVVKTLGFVEGRRILDVGCNTGIFCAMLDDGQRVLDGVDILPEEVRIAKDFFANDRVRFHVRDILKKPFPKETFDCILFLETIEHVENPYDFLRTFHRMLKPGGVLVVSTPNAASYFHVGRYFIPDMKKKLLAINEQPRNTGTHMDHIYLWDVYALYRLLNRAGFTYVEHAIEGVYPPAALKDIPLDYLSPVVGRFGETLIFKVRKIEDNRRQM